MCNDLERQEMWSVQRTIKEAKGGCRGENGRELCIEMMQGTDQRAYLKLESLEAQNSSAVAIKT